MSSVSWTHGAMSWPQAKALPADSPPLIAGPLRMKLRMYIFLMALMLLNICVEIYLHSLKGSSGKMWPVLTVYEVSNVFIVGSMGFFFRPR